MVRVLIYCLLFTLIGYGLWPYATIYRLNDALASHDGQTRDLARFVDMDALRSAWQRRLASENGLRQADASSDPQVRWMAEHYEAQGADIVARAITLTWVHDLLGRVSRGPAEDDAGFLWQAIDFTAFESHDRFYGRIGELGAGATHLRWRLDPDALSWKLTDLIP